MRKTYKKYISLCAVLILVISLFPTSAFAADPFSAIAIGGLGGSSGAGLFGSMASVSGYNVSFPSGTNIDQADALWNDLNPNNVYFNGTKGQEEKTIEGQPVLYDYLKVDLLDWLTAQRDFIKEFAYDNSITDNSSGNISENMSFGGYPLTYNSSLDIYMTDFLGLMQENSSYSIGGVELQLGTKSGSYISYYVYIDGILGYSGQTTFYSSRYIACFSTNLTSTMWFAAFSSTKTSKTNIQQTGKTRNNGYTADWESDELNLDIFNTYTSPKIEIPHSSWNPSDPVNWSIQEFLRELTNKHVTGNESDIIITDDSEPPPPVPPQPMPTTPLGQMPYDEWFDLFGQSVFDAYHHIELGIDNALIPVQQDIADGVDDIIGLETNIDENIEDLIIYVHDISNDTDDISTEVGSIGEDVEDIKDDVVIIVDDLGNVIDVLEGIEAQEYINGQELEDLADDVGTLVQTETAISTDVADITDNVADIKEAVEDIVPYVVPITDIATDTETMVDILPDIKTATETATDTLTDTLPDIKDATQTITDTLPDIIAEIQDATTTLTDDIPNIDDICLNIDEAPYKDIDTGLDRLPRFLIPFITDLRSALGIWHYVTEWLAQISTTFAFISGCLIGTSIMTPIYAAIAGFMCIKIYRRMTA